MLFITVRFLDILDILMVAFILYELYRLIKGTIAFNIFIGIFIIYLFWLLVRALNMELISSLMGQIMGVGLLALIVVFQQEIRQFLMLIGANNIFSRFLRTDKLFSVNRQHVSDQQVRMLVKACENMARTRTGALIVIAQNSELRSIMQTGERIDARISDALIETVFFKNTPLHDGAMLIAGDKIIAARCILPVTERQNLDPTLGLRHRSAIGITEVTDAITIVVSEERGSISVVKSGQIREIASSVELSGVLGAAMNVAAVTAAAKT
ncbi:MAG: diadenylate cyclase CdaA [Bacteroidales bacterium]|nr:diadenylate cyclase CdaA [Bacteroidales bacterium]